MATANGANNGGNTASGNTAEGERVCAWLTALTWELAQAKDAHAELRRELRLLKHDLWLARTGTRRGVKRIKRHAS